MKVVTKNPATEMAIQTPSENDLKMMRAIFPNPSQFPFPTPAELREAYYDYAQNNSNFYNTTDASNQYVTGDKKKGSGTAIASYPRLYDNAIKPLQDLWEIRDDPRAVVNYLWENPVYYKADKNPDIFKNLDRDLTDDDISKYVAFCFSNLMEWMYLSSIPVHQYVREHLLEKVRYLRKKYSASNFARGLVKVLPQRPRTSRSLGENETELHLVNAGYRIVTTENPFTREQESVLELLTWFFTDSHTKKRVFKDYFDVEEGNFTSALRKMRSSDLYRSWAISMSPKKYAEVCSAYEIMGASDKELEGLIPIQKDPENK